MAGRNEKVREERTREWGLVRNIAAGMIELDFFLLYGSYGGIFLVSVYKNIHFFYLFCTKI